MKTAWNQSISQWIFHRLPVIIYCIAIFVQSSFPAPQVIPAFAFSDKVLHLFGYALLGGLFLRAFKTFPIKKDTVLLLLLSVICSILYGISDEFHQSFIPYRTADVYDALFDAIGSFLGVMAYHYLFRFRFIRGQKN